MLKISAINSDIYSKYILIIILINSFFGYFFNDIINYLVLVVSAIGLLLTVFINSAFKLNSYQVLIIGLFVLFITIQVLPSTYSLFPKESLSSSIVISVTFLLGILLVLKGKFYGDFVLKTLLILSIIHGVITFILFLFPELYNVIYLPEEIKTSAHKFISNGTYTGITDQIGRNAYFISLGLSVIFVSMISTNSKKKYWLILYFIMLLSLLLTGKRGHLLASIISMFFTSLTYSKIRGKSVILKAGLFLCTSTVSVLVVIMLFPAAASPFQRTIERLDGDITSGRIQLYEKAINLFQDKPVFGWGRNTFSNLYDKGNHNVYLQLLSENGIVGIIVFLSLATVLFSYTTKLISSSYNRDEYLKYLLFSLYMQIYFIFYGITGNPLNDNYFLVVYIVGTLIPFTFRIKRVE
ncbi:O-antigen ligase family protein [Alkalibacillus sp. S2W]|uniref:O-antigen ligase family protein n=1 Tax=Alkalibacillus sp. S2W TaxID=3386553 RepID=UPI00398CB518